jgi:hypothetical protein
VTYLPAHPETHCRGNPEDNLRQQNLGYVLAAGAGTAALATWFVWLFFGMRRELHLARAGQAVAGRVNDGGSERGKQETRYWVRYRFKSDDGEQRTGRHYVPWKVYCELPIGTRVTVLYDPDHPRHHRPLFAFTHVRFLPPHEAA